MNVLCNGHVPRAVGMGSNDTPFLGKYYFFPLSWVYDPPPPFFQPYYGNDLPKVYLQPWVPPPFFFFENFEKSGHLI